MLPMANINDIRERYFVKGQSISEISRETGHDRKTVRDYINMDDFSTEIPEQEKRGSKLDEFKLTIDEWLEEDLLHKRKQRHTATRVHKRLCEFDEFDCSYRLVADYVKKKKEELFSTDRFAMPLVHKPGEAQIDFGDSQYYERGVLKDGNSLNVSFPYSNNGYLQQFPGENMECFMQGMKNIFNYLGKVPGRIWFDNASTLVSKILKGGGRKLTDSFMRFKSHYGFEAVFCNPDSGNEKGNVENKVGYHRRNILVPVPRFDSIEHFNIELLDSTIESNARKHYIKNLPHNELFLEDEKNMLPLNPVEFRIEKLEQHKTDKYAKVRLDGGKHIYSAAPKYACQKVWVELGAYEVRILDENYREITSHSRLYGKMVLESMDWIPYLGALSRRPGALKYSGIYEMMPKILRDYTDSVDKSEQGKMLKQLAAITEESGFEMAIEALIESINRGGRDPDSVLAVSRMINDKYPDMEKIANTTSVPILQPIKSNLVEYDGLLEEGRIN